MQYPPKVVCSYCGRIVSQDYMIFPDGRYGCFCTKCAEQWEEDYKELLNDN